MQCKRLHYITHDTQSPHKPTKRPNYRPAQSLDAIDQTEKARRNKQKKQKIKDTTEELKTARKNECSESKEGERQKDTAVK